jgi:hypothetical protein
MTEEYVRSIMDKWGLDDAVIAMHKLRKELSPENFTLEKTEGWLGLVRNSARCSLTE